MSLILVEKMVPILIHLAQSKYTPYQHVNYPSTKYLWILTQI